VLNVAVVVSMVSSFLQTFKNKPLTCVSEFCVYNDDVRCKIARCFDWHSSMYWLL